MSFARNVLCQNKIGKKRQKISTNLRRYCLRKRKNRLCLWTNSFFVLDIGIGMNFRYFRIQLKYQANNSNALSTGDSLQLQCIAHIKYFVSFFSESFRFRWIHNSHRNFHIISSWRQIYLLQSILALHSNKIHIEGKKVWRRERVNVLVRTCGQPSVCDNKSNRFPP